MVAAVLTLFGAPRRMPWGISSDDQWYRAVLEHGETNGYLWSVSAAGPKHEPLREIGTLELPQDGSEYAGTGERKVYFPAVPTISNRVSRGFQSSGIWSRPLLASSAFAVSTTFDKAGGVIRNEPDPICSAG